MSYNSRKVPKLTTIDIDGLPDLESDKFRYHERLDALSTP